LPYLARKHGPAEVNVTIRAVRLPTGVYPAQHAEQALSVIRQAFPSVLPCGNALSGALMNAGPVIHPPLVVMNAAPLQHFERWDIHHEGTTPAVRAVTDEGTVSAFDEAAGRLILSQEGFGGPAQIVEASGEAPRALTDHNAAALAGTDLPEGESFTFPGWTGEAVQGWVFKPAGYVEGRRYPAVYLIHGGPKSPWTDGWSYRWNPQIYTGAGYAVVMVNFHGSPGFGQAFTDSITSHWGDRPLEDLQKGWESALASNAFIDGDRACALGASYGGYMVNLIAGKWNGPWRCLVNHAGVFDVGQLMNAMDLATFIAEFEGPSWERADLYRDFSPNTWVGDWSKPMLVLHGSRDFRVPVEQGLATFSALQRRGIESRFVHVPDENHWVLKPRNWVDWQQEILDWTFSFTNEASAAAERAANEAAAAAQP
jgi:acylaminoacyl-peptidase